MPPEQSLAKPGYKLSWKRGKGHPTQEIHLKTPYDKQAVAFRSSNAADIVLNSAWSEIVIGTRLSRWEETKEILWGVKFTFQQGTQQTENEIDLILRSSQRVFFFECKKGLRTTIDIDKFAAAARKFGGSGAIPCLVVADQITSKNLRSNVEDCCKHNGVHLLYLPEETDESLYKQLKEWNKKNRA